LNEGVFADLCQYWTFFFSIVPFLALVSSPLTLPQKRFFPSLVPSAVDFLFSTCTLFKVEEALFS